MQLRNTSHKPDAWVLLHFHWVRKQMKIDRNHIALLVTRTKKWDCWLCDLWNEARWRGRWMHYFGFGHKIVLRVTDGGRNERMMWIRGFAHELCHSVGGTEKECKDAEDWAERKWEKEHG